MNDYTLLKSDYTWATGNRNLSYFFLGDDQAHFYIPCGMVILWCVASEEIGELSRGGIL